MQVNEIRVPFGQGHIAVRDYQGSGRDVLLVHTPGLCALNWDVTAEALGGQCRAYALDLPGHAHSTAELTEFDDAWRAIGAVVRELGLQRPLLVAHDNAAYVCLVAAAAEPDLYSAVMTIGGSNVRTHEEADELLSFMRSTDFTDMLGERFLFGATVSAQEGPEVLVDRVFAANQNDWMLEGIEERIRREAAYSVRELPDGRFVNTPTVETMQRVLDLSSNPDYHFDSSIYAQVTLPVWLLQLTEGFDARAAEAERQLAERLPQLRLGVLSSGQWPQYTAAKELAAWILRVAEDPAGQGADVA